MKAPISGETLSVLLTGRHVKSLATRFCFLFTSVTYVTPCHTIGPQVIYCECDGFQGAFFTLKHSYLKLLPAF